MPDKKEIWGNSKKSISNYIQTLQQILREYQCVRLENINYTKEVHQDKIEAVNLSIVLAELEQKKINDSQVKYAIEQEERNYNPLSGQQRITMVGEIKIIRNNRATIVILADGSKGVSKCMENDLYNSDIGYNIAYNKAMVKFFKKQLKEYVRQVN